MGMLKDTESYLPLPQTHFFMVFEFKTLFQSIEHTVGARHK